MALSVIVSAPFRQALHYTNSKVPQIYSKRIFNMLANKIVYYIRQLPLNPKMGMVEPGTEHLGYEVRRIVVKPYFKLIYSITSNSIVFRDIWDTRQDPDYLVGRL